MLMPLSELLPALGAYETLPPARADGLCPPPASFGITALCCDSRKAVDTCLFFCLVGALSDGHDYAVHAYRAGTRFFVVERPVDLPGDAVQFRVDNTRAALADAAGAFYRHPDREMRLIGLTGTKGKTTTAGLIAAILNASGIPTGYIGTNGIDFAGLHFPTVNSTPESLEIAHYLRYMLDMGVKTCVMEVSSQALWTYRVRGLAFDTVLFTNLSRDHIGGNEHPDFEHYAACKHSLFTDYGAKAVIANADDPNALWMTRGASAPVVWFGTRKTFTRRSADPAAESANAPGTQAAARPVPAGRQTDPAAANDTRPRLSWIGADVTPARRNGRPGVTFSLAREGRILGGAHFLPMPGAYSVSNLLGALAVACGRCGVPEGQALAAAERITVPGRFETFSPPAQPDVTYIIDYAHNGVSLAAVLDALRAYEPTRVIALFGSVGGRTFERRRALAEAAARRADLCIITADNPGPEDPAHTVRDIDACFPPDACPRLLIPDREEAIRRAVALARPGDFILLAGKGHEDYQLVGKERRPFRERGIVMRAAKEAEITDKVKRE